MILILSFFIEFAVRAELPSLNPAVLEFTAKGLANGECPSRGSVPLTASVPNSEEFFHTYRKLYYESPAPLVKRVSELGGDLHLFTNEEARSQFPDQVRKLDFRQAKYFLLTAKGKRQLIGFAPASNGLACEEIGPVVAPPTGVRIPRGTPGGS